MNLSVTTQLILAVAALLTQFLVGGFTLLGTLLGVCLQNRHARKMEESRRRYEFKANHVSIVRRGLARLHTLLDYYDDFKGKEAQFRKEIREVRIDLETSGMALQDETLDALIRDLGNEIQETEPDKISENQNIVRIRDDIHHRLSQILGM